ncbi:hypothetical protein SPRG_20479 [Saprolegnia parasitica CBS 223.65]|uniref:Uncharacterized protein n=1 Tax=Saprolegnia parasitica (strain CBS 223.65) TaxID=695850 RepID=A0A067CC11_SAPPC|nr:hypothetical protein SPRG_20479 [Saprolegnia parasitica CBS 223.65]KDO26675.1 hypothetical protein SPRG_20479 [Saprolegnia parasitica CBS 223.65]|eukprot:XP_012202573.1 hypothetical protein SPRG_20479 [Saprolegnia parasitica CBS 223.65]
MDAVLHSRDLLDVVFAYQDGWYKEQLELIVSLQLRGLDHLVRSAQEQPMPSIDVVASILEPWIAAHGLLAVRRAMRDMANLGCMLFLYCASRNDAALLASLHETTVLSPFDQRRLVHAAATHGAVDVLAFLSAHAYEGFSADTMDTAAGAGHLHIVQYLTKQRMDGCTTRAMDQAIFHGHHDVVEWLYAHRTEGCSHSGLLFAAKRGNDRLVRRIIADGRMRLLGSEIVHAARYGHLDLVTFLAASTSACHLQRAQDAATLMGHTAVAHFLTTRLAVH